MKSIRSLLVLALAWGWFPATTSLWAQESEPADATRAAGQGGDPLAWIGQREIHFVARAGSAGAVLRSGPDPAYREVRRLEPGTLLLAVADRPGYVGVLVPDGYTAYIHSRYVEVGAEDIGTVTSNRVNVRSIPSSTGDYPIGQVSTGRKLWVWGRAENGSDWLRITAPGDLPVWVADGEIDIAGTLGEHPELVGEIALMRAERSRSFEERSPAAIARAEARRRSADTPAMLEVAMRLLRDEELRGAEGDFSQVKDLLSRIFADTLDPQVRRDAEELDRRIALVERNRAQEAARQEMLDELARQKEALRLERERLAQARVAKPPEPVQAQQGEIGSWSGFLRLRPDDGQHPVALEQGTKVVAWLSCDSGKIVLRDFAGLQIRADGRVASLDGAPVVEVSRLEILRR